MPRSFRQLKLELSERDFGEFAIEIAEAYISSNFKSKTEIGKEYELNQKAVTEFIDYAIIHYLVNDYMVNQIERKSIQNQRRFSPDGSAESTIAHYRMLRKKRNEFVICQLSDEKIKQIAEYFAKETSKTKGDIAIMYGLSKPIIDIILKKAITERICDDDTFEKIEKRSVNNCSKDNYEKTKIFFERLRARRNANKENFFA